MKAIILLLLTTLSFLTAAQPLFTLSLEKKNPRQQSLFVDNDGFSVAVLEYVDHTMTFFMKPGIGKLSEYEISREGGDFEGFGSNDREFNVYFTSDLKKRKVLTFYQDSKNAEVKDILISELHRKDKEYAHFTRENKFYKIFRNNKHRQLSIYEFSGSMGKKIGSFTIPKDVFKELDGRNFKYIPEHGNVSLDLFISNEKSSKKISSNKLYWSGDSIIFAYHDKHPLPEKDEHMYVSLNLKKKIVSVRVISAGIKTSKVNDYLLGDKIFFVSMYHLYRGPFRYDDSLFLEVLDVHSLQKIRRLEVSPETGINWKSTPFVSTLGDTLENEWKAERRQEKIFSELAKYPLFIQVTKNSADQYVLTLGVQTYNTTIDTPGPSSGTTIQGGGFGRTTLGPVEYFKGCLSTTFDTTTCQDVITSQDRAFVRKWKLEKRIISHGVYYKPYTDFLISCNSQHSYLMYIERDSKTLLIEQF